MFRKHKPKQGRLFSGKSNAPQAPVPSKKATSSRFSIFGKPKPAPPKVIRQAQVPPKKPGRGWFTSTSTPAHSKQASVPSQKAASSGYSIFGRKPTQAPTPTKPTQAPTPTKPTQAQAPPKKPGMFSSFFGSKPLTDQQEAARLKAKQQKAEKAARLKAEKAAKQQRLAAAEAKKQAAAEEQRQRLAAAEEQRRLTEQRKQAAAAEEQRQRLANQAAEEQRLANQAAEEQRQRLANQAAEEQRLAEEERLAAEEEQRLAEEERLAAEEQRLAEEEEQRRLAEAEEAAAEQQRLAASTSGSVNAGPINNGLNRTSNRNRMIAGTVNNGTVNNGTVNAGTGNNGLNRNRVNVGPVNNRNNRNPVNVGLEQPPVKSKFRTFLLVFAVLLALGTISTGVFFVVRASQWKSTTATVTKVNDDDVLFKYSVDSEEYSGSLSLAKFSNLSKGDSFDIQFKEKSHSQYRLQSDLNVPTPFSKLKISWKTAGFSLISLGAFILLILLVILFLNYFKYA